MKGPEYTPSVLISAVTAVLLAVTYPLSVIALDTVIKSDVPISVDDDLTVVIPTYQNLPPDPGVMGDETVAGIDSDKDGVRDDIQREIVFKYPDNAKARTVLYEIAKQYQFILLNSNSPNLVQDSYGYIIAWTRCLQVATGGRGASFTVLEPQLANTDARTQAYLVSMRASETMGDPPTKFVNCP